MGLLDDAIREHLELKRRRGADPAEVSQQEREALGPVRGAADAATAEPPAAAAANEHEHPPEQPAAVDAEHHGAVRAPDPAEEPEPEPAPSDPAGEPDDLRGAAQPDGHEHAGPDADAAGEDVLDATPDFLQEPEHDRLWFEQRPPRDFDF